MPHRLHGAEMPTGLSKFMQQLWDHGHTPVFRPEEGVVQYVTKNPKAGAIEIGGFYGEKAIPMVDIDIPDEAHPVSGITARGRGEAIEQLKRLVRIGKAKVQRVYATPGGIRSFELGDTMPPGKWWKGHDVGDPFYRRFTTQPKVVIQGGKSKRIPPTFTFRLSEKMNRPEGQDFVAALLGTIGDEGLTLPDSLRKVRRYHDNRIRLNRRVPVDETLESLRAKIALMMDEFPPELLEQVKRMYKM